MNYYGKWVNIVSFKHDGNLHRIWDRGFVVLDNDDFIAVATKRAKVIENNGRKWFTKEPAVTVFSKKHWFNVICMFKLQGPAYYCNIASPTVIDKSTIKYIDYDLDLWLFPNGEIKLVDEKEFEFHKTKYGYSDRLNTVIQFETEKCREMIQNRIFPFNDSEIKKLYDDYLSTFSKENKKAKDD